MTRCYSCCPFNCHWRDVPFVQGVLYWHGSIFICFECCSTFEGLKEIIFVSSTIVATVVDPDVGRSEIILDKVLVLEIVCMTLNI